MTKERLQEELDLILKENKPAQIKATQLQGLCAMILQCFEQGEMAQTLHTFPEALRVQIDTMKDKNNFFIAELAQNEELLKEQECLEKDYASLKEKSAVLESLKEKNAALAAVDLSAWKTETEKYILYNAEFMGNLTEALTALNQTLENADFSVKDDFKSLVAKSLANLKYLNSKRLELLETLSSGTLVTAIGFSRDEIKGLLDSYNAHVQKLGQVKEDLDAIKANHENILDAFKMHLLENDAVFGGLHSEFGVKDFVAKLSSDVAAQLARYDLEIRIIVEKRDSLPIFQLMEERVNP